MIAGILLISALKSYVLVGMISCLVMPRARQAIFGAFAEGGCRTRSMAARAFYAIGLLVVTAVGWPSVLRRAYLNDAR